MALNSDFGYLGIPYQKRLVSQLVSDHKFANNIIDIIDANYFTHDTLRTIVGEIKNAYDEKDVIPDMESLEFRLAARYGNDTDKLFTSLLLTEISTLTNNDYEEVQKNAFKFCKQQKLAKSIAEIQKIIEKGDLDDYDKCEDILKDALESGEEKDEAISVFHDLDSVLSPDFRNPIPTGIDGLDGKMNGGLAKSELALVLAPFGIGKTTMLTKIANHGFDLGHNVLQIFFEDNPKVIQRKHISCWTKIKLNDLGEEENRAMIDDVLDLKNANKGYLKLRKFPSDGTTIPMIRSYIRKLASRGQKPDILILDYIDCVAPSRSFDNEWTGEGNIMRQFETLLSEFDIAGWTAMQGNRSSIKATEVDSTMIGGSIKKGQIGHFIVSLARSDEQKEEGLATMAILKSRFGPDGILFEDILFDNETVQISAEKGACRTKMEVKNAKTGDDLAKINELLNRQNKINGEDFTPEID